MSELHQALTPLAFGTLRLRHRLIVPPHGGGTGSLVKDDAAYERYVAYWLQRVEDGFQWIGGGPGYVRRPVITGFEPTGTGASGSVEGLFRHPLYPQRAGSLIEKVHAAGGYASVQLVLQGGMPTAPSAHLSGYLDHRATHVLDGREIEQQVEEYVFSALTAIEAGVDVVEMHANHDDLVQWFISPLTNRRTDAWGGSFDKRRRFLREIVEGVRARTPRPITLGLRLALSEEMAGGAGIEDCIAIVKAFEAEGTVDYISLDIGHNWGPVSYLQHGMYAEGEWAGLCGQVKRETALPVIYVGRVVHPETAERIVTSGQADLVGMVRALIAEPQWLRKATSGRTQEIRPCIGMNDCIHRYTLDGLGFGCAVNVRAGREGTPEPPPPARPFDLLVVGGGPAGSELAALAAERGHRVALWEQRDHLGGALADASGAAINSLFRDWLGYQQRRLADLGVKVELGRTGTAADVLGAGADVVAIATGSRPRDPHLPGQELPHVLDYIAAMSAPLAGRRVALIVEDDGPAPLTVADHLAGLGHEVTFVHQSPGPAPLVGKYSSGAWFARLDAVGVRFVPMARAVGITEGTVLLENTYSGRAFTLDGIDAVVLACGGTGADELYVELAGRHPRVHLLGDAFAPRRMTFATRQAYELMLTLEDS
jgi:2,4-dienoyl-CoA reductase-like NADH-dependent reductase (Old Yellow Enzyme family)/thioredoxin reductase